MEHEVEVSWKLGLWSFQLCLRENPTPSFPRWQQALWATESASAAALLTLTCLEPRVDLALRERALDMCLSFNQVGHVGREASLWYFYISFPGPRLNTDSQWSISTEERKRSMGFLLHLQRSVAWANFYSGAHLICDSSPSLCMCAGRLVANICFDKTRFPSELSSLVQQKKCVLPTPCW